MSETEMMIEPREEEIQVADWRTRTLMIGGAIGTVLGILAAYLYVRAAEEAHSSQAPEMPTKDAVRVGLSLLTIVRQIAELGARR